MSLRPGETFSRYLVEEKLGEGGTGEVYRAMDTRLGRKVALKLLRRDAEGESEAFVRQVRRMLREARFAAALRDPGIVAVYDAGEHEGVPFVAMELAEGKPLRQLVGADLPLGERVFVLRAVARALSVAHRAGLVHRDVKPENVIVGRGLAVKVLDFGIARRTDQGGDGALTQDDAAARTGDNAFVGTPAYMAPEQVKGEPEGPEADQFAWGVVAYELITGHLPFRSDRGAGSLIASILSDDPRPMDRRDAPAALEAIVSRALQKDPADRYPSMDAVAAALEPFVAARATDSTRIEAPRSWPRRPQKEVSNASPRSSRRAALGALSVVVFVAAAVVFVRCRPQGPEKPAALGPFFPAPLPTPVTALPLPETPSAAARDAYREGLQAMRDGAWMVAYAAFERATRLDPSLAGAWMRMALVIQDQDATLARGFLRKAQLGRGALGARDAGLLDALEPVIQGSPSDIPETTTRLALLRARFPGDAEIASLYAVFAAGMLSPEDALAAVDRCLAIDPLDGDCLQSRARTLFRRLGRVEEGISALERCIAASPGASDCFFDLATVHSSLGRCDLVEQDARGFIARSPRSPLAYDLLAAAIHARDPRSSAVATTALAASTRYREHGLRGEEARRLVEIDIAAGHFDEAERRLLDLEREMADDPSEDAQAWPAYMRVALLSELGRKAEAGRVAEAFVARRGTMIGGFAGLRWFDHTMIFWRAKLDAGLARRDEYEAARAAFFREHEGSDRMLTKLGAWAYGEGFVAKDASEARAALARVPSISTSRERRVELDVGLAFDAALGHAHFLGGNAALSLPHLVSAASSCMGLSSPFVQVTAIAELGHVRELQGDREGACDAYGRVLARFGDVRGSVTAEDARSRVSALGCGR